MAICASFLRYIEESNATVKKCRFLECFLNKSF
jgi:hypothetical protein